MPTLIELALFEPRIPQNTGNIARTCAAFNIKLNLIQPLGFSLEDKYLKRAGLDYWKFLKLDIHKDYASFFEKFSKRRIIGFSKNGKENLNQFNFRDDDILLFGREDTGLSKKATSSCITTLYIPMAQKANNDGKGGVRSLNLSVSVGIAAYKALL